LELYGLRQSVTSAGKRLELIVIEVVVTLRRCGDIVGIGLGLLGSPVFVDVV
jgi:hypothetical protein